MIASSVIRDTFMALESFEHGLNIAGYIPILGTFSARVRRVYGNLEFITGIALAILGAAMKYQGNASHAFYLTIGATLIGHGVLNAIRSYFEELPVIPLFTTLPYDLIATYYVGRRFFSYQHLI